MTAFPKVPDFRIQLASFYLVNGRKDEGDKLLDEVLSKPQEFPEGRIKVGDFYVRARNFPKAQQVFQEGAALNDSKRTQYRLKEALVVATGGKPDEALKLVEAVVKDDASSNDALSLRAALMLQSGNKEQVQAAIDDLQKLIGKMPGNLVVRYNLARAYHERGELDAARIQYQEAIKIRKDFIAAHLGLGQIYLLKKDYGKAIQTTDDIFRYSPQNLGAQVIRVNALINSGNLLQARTDCNNFLQQHPTSPDLQFQIALIDISQQHYKEADGGIRSLRTRFPNDPRLLFTMAEVLLATGKNEEALNLLRAEAGKAPQREDLKNAVGNACLRSNKFDEAEAEFRKLINMNSKNPAYYLKLGEVLRRKGEAQQALDMLRQGQQLSPDDPVANLQVAMTMETLGMRGESRPFYERVLKVQPDNAIALNNVAFMMAEEGTNLDEALSNAQKAKQQLPTNPDVSDTMGWIYLKKNMSESALTIFLDLTTKNPKNPLYHYHLGMAQYQKGDKAAAKRSLQTALGLRPDKDTEPKIRELLSKIG